MKSKYSLQSILIDWLFQDIGLIQRLFSGEPFFAPSELLCRSLLELTLSLTLMTLLSYFIPILYALIVAFLLIHSLNWYFNGHGFLIFLTLFGPVCPQEKRKAFVKGLAFSFETKNVSSVLYGSLSLEKSNERSDIDVFVINDQGLINGLKLSILVTAKRVQAIIHSVPLDIYCIDDYRYLIRRINIRKKEKSFLILSDPKNRIEKNIDLPTKRLTL